MLPRPQLLRDHQDSAAHQKHASLPLPQTIWQELVLFKVNIRLQTQQQSLHESQSWKHK